MVSCYLHINKHLILHQDKEFVSILALIDISNKNVFSTDCLIIFTSVTRIILLRR